LGPLVVWVVAGLACARLIVLPLQTEVTGPKQCWSSA